ncbi:MAG: penicillin-binding protein 2 [Acidimicrobiales bacterium]
MNNDSARFRLTVIAIVVMSLFSALFARLWYLQVIDADTFQTLATQNQVRVVFEPAPRGRILDRQGRPLVENRVSQVVTVQRQVVGDRPEVLVRLAALVGVSRPELQRRLGDVRYSPFRPVPVAEDVSESVVVYLREHEADFPGVEALAVAQRSYPTGPVPLAAHVLGYVGEINEKELATRKTQGYRLGDDIGKSGIEQAYEADLRGRPGRVELEVDANGRVLRTLANSTPPVRGNDVQLTVDLDVQRVTEESLAQALLANRERNDRQDGRPFASPAGAAVVLDPRDGSVLAMASYPTFNPADFNNGIRTDVYAALQDPAGHLPLNNRAIAGQYAPGSTFKLVTALAALQRGAINANTTFVDEGTYRLRNCRGERCVFRNAGSRAYGRVNLARALTVSSDAFFYDLGANFWSGGGPNSLAIQETARSLGIGARTGIALSGEQRGRVPDPESRRRLHEQNATAFPEGNWRTGDNVNLSIGQGETVVTPLQLANAYASFANGGTVYTPRLVAKVVRADGGSVREVAAEAAGQVAIAPAQRAPILQGLQGAVADEAGTAFFAFAGFPLDSFAVAGKTGTAQVSRRQDTSLFAAFAPAAAPQFAIAVVMEESGFGASAAAPVARRVFDVLSGREPAPIALTSGSD